MQLIDLRNDQIGKQHYCNLSVTSGNMFPESGFSSRLVAATIFRSLEELAVLPALVPVDQMDVNVESLN